jgi:hypothetical protein
MPVSGDGVAGATFAKDHSREPGGASALQDLRGGSVDVMIDIVSSVRPHAGAKP